MLTSLLRVGLMALAVALIGTAPQPPAPAPPTQPPPQRPQRVLYDATFYTNKPPSTVMTAVGGGQTPCLPGLKPCILTDRGNDTRPWRYDAKRHDSIALDKVVAWLDSIPRASFVCLDVEHGYDIVTTLLTLCKARRPDCTWGFYVGPENVPGFQWGDIDVLAAFKMPPHLDAACKAADFIAPCIYGWPDQSRLIQFRTWVVWYIKSFEHYGKPIHPVISVHSHPQSAATQDADADTYCGDAAFTAQLKGVELAGGTGIFWAGWDFARGKPRPWKDAHPLSGTSRFWQIEAWLKGGAAKAP